MGCIKFLAALLSVAVCISMGLNTPALAEACDETNRLIVSTPVTEQSRGGLQEYRESIRSIPQNPSVVLLGDSIANGWGKVSDAFPGEVVFNYGVSGDRIQNVLWRLSDPAIASISPKKLIIILGTNNMVDSGMDACSVVLGIEKVVAKSRTLWPSTRIYVFAILPRGADFKSSEKIRLQVNGSLNEVLSTVENVKFVNINDSEFTCGQNSLGELNADTLLCSPENAFSCRNYQSDNVHPNFTGYKKLREYLNNSGF